MPADLATAVADGRCVMEWTRRVPSVGGKYWIRGVSPKDGVFDTVVSKQIRDVRIVDYGLGANLCEVLMNGTSFRGEGWQNFGKVGADECDGFYKLEFAGPILEPAESPDAR